MAKKANKRSSSNPQEPAVVAKEPRSLAIAQNGVTTASEFASMMSALMSDVVEGRVAPGAANAACNAGGKLLKSVEMQQKYGTQDPRTSRRNLQLVETK